MIAGRRFRSQLSFDSAALWLWGNRNLRLPVWFTERFPARYTTRSPFVSDLPAGMGLEPLPEQPNGVPVSVPERALLEMLSEVGIHQGVEEARSIMEGVRSLRPEVLALLLQHCQRIKAARLCVYWAGELQLRWAEGARKAAAQHMTGRRWSARLKSGIRLEPFLLMDANYIDAVLSRPCVGQESDNLRVRACGDRFPRQGILPG
jgi:hypothetical protein